MNFPDRLMMLIKEKKTNNNKLTAELNLSKSAVYDWTHRGCTPSSDALKILAAYFDVTTDYLLGNTDKREKPVDDDELIEFEVSPDEEEIIKTLRALSPEVRRVVLRAAGVPEEHIF